MKIRSLIAAVVAALLVPALASAAPAKAAPASSGSTASGGGLSIQGLSVGGFVGYTTDDLSGFALRADAELPFRKLTPQLNLSWVGSVGYSRMTDSAFGIDVTGNVLTIVPAARFTFPVNPQISLFGDAGLGLYYASLKTEMDIPFFGRQSASDSEFSLMMRFEVGAFYQVNPKTQLGALIGIDPMFGDFDQNPWNIMVGAMFKI